MVFTSLLIALIIFGVILALANTIPMDATVKKVINIVAIAALCIWLIREFLPLLHF